MECIKCDIKCNYYIYFIWKVDEWEVRVMDIKGMYEDGLCKDIVAYYERTHDLDNAK